MRTDLTKRQRQVLSLAAHGRTNAQIGTQLGIHPATVNRHLTEVYATLGAHDRANAVTIAIHLGEISLAEVARIAAAAASPRTDHTPAEEGRLDR